jgi:ATP-dependent DNA ligase
MRLSFIKPMEPELFDTPPGGDDWSHEIKFDGYRTQVIKDEDGIRMLTKNGFDWTARYPYLSRKPPRSRPKPSSSKAKPS